jgi:hypothetical protein
MIEQLGYFLVAYALFAGGIIFLMTFGRSPIFAGTVVERASDFIAGGCLDSGLCVQTSQACQLRPKVGLMQSRLVSNLLEMQGIYKEDMWDCSS